MRLFVLYTYDSISKRPNPWVKEQIAKLRRRRRQKLRRFARRYYPIDNYVGSETLYLRRVEHYRRRFRVAIFFGIIVCTSLLLHISGVL